MRICDSPVVDEQVYSSAKEVGRLLDFLSNLGDVSEIAYCRAEAIRVLL
jgi:hypothetical protein